MGHDAYISMGAMIEAWDMPIVCYCQPIGAINDQEHVSSMVWML